MEIHFLPTQQCASQQGLLFLVKYHLAVWLWGLIYPIHVENTSWDTDGYVRASGNICQHKNGLGKYQNKRQAMAELVAITGQGFVTHSNLVCTNLKKLNKTSQIVSNLKFKYSQRENFKEPVAPCQMGHRRHIILTKILYNKLGTVLSTFDHYLIKTSKPPSYHHLYFMYMENGVQISQIICPTSHC